MKLNKTGRKAPYGDPEGGGLKQILISAAGRNSGFSFSPKSPSRLGFWEVLDYGASAP